MSYIKNSACNTIYRLYISIFFNRIHIYNSFAHIHTRTHTFTPNFKRIISGLLLSTKILMHVK